MGLAHPPLERTDCCPSRLPEQLHAEADDTPGCPHLTDETPRGHRRNAKACTFAGKTSVFQEWIHGAEIWMVEGVDHAHVPLHLEILPHVDRLEELEVADV